MTTVVTFLVLWCVSSVVIGLALGKFIKYGMGE